METKFKEGDKVVKILTGDDKGVPREISREEKIIKEIDGKVIYLEDDEGFTEKGTTYNLQGMENELFFPGMFARIELI